MCVLYALIHPYLKIHHHAQACTEHVHVRSWCIQYTAGRHPEATCLRQTSAFPCGDPSFAALKKKIKKKVSVNKAAAKLFVTEERVYHFSPML